MSVIQKLFDAENNNFEKCLMLPIHFGLKQNDFMKIISKLK